MDHSELISIPDFKYWYDAELRSVYDADTMRVNLNLGLGITASGDDGKGVVLRLFGIDAWELRGPERPHGIEARDFVRWLLQDKNILINTIADDTGKYGRLLAIVFVEISPGIWLDLNQELVNNGYAEVAEY